MTDILKKPIHPALLKKTPLDAVKPKLGEQPGALGHPERQPLPEEAQEGPQKPRLPRLALGAGPSTLIKQEGLKRHLRVFYDALPSPLYPPDQTPPCDTCKTSPCCSSFIVELSKEEYESGLYNPYAVKLEPEVIKQLRTLLPPVWRPLKDTSPSYVIEGIQGEPCPFLGKDRKCTIYEWRPYTCREYTCKNDARITQELRDGIQ